MVDEVVHLRTQDELRMHVHQTLCRSENLLAEQFGLQIVPLKRLNVWCGLQFLLQGPRNVRLGAVWSSEQSALYFYNARGERFLKQLLPKLDDPAAFASCMS